MLKAMYFFSVDWCNVSALEYDGLIEINAFLDWVQRNKNKVLMGLINFKNLGYIGN